MAEPRNTHLGTGTDTPSALTPGSGAKPDAQQSDRDAPRAAHPAPNTAAPEAMADPRREHADMAGETVAAGFGATPGTCGASAAAGREVDPAAWVRAALRDVRYVVPLGVAAVLVLVQICYPLSSGVGRDRVTVLVVLLSVGTAMVHAGLTRGFGYAVGFLGIVSGLGLVAELVGTATGVPFGDYEYAVDRLGPAVYGVPVIVALAWTGGLYPVWVVAGLLARRVGVRVGLTAVGAVGWDLFLDPQMVADGQWVWANTDAGLPGLAQIPWTNFVGWFGVALVMAVLLTGWERVGRTEGSVDVPVAVFLWTWLGSALAHAVFLDLRYSAWYGVVGMGVLGVPLLNRLRRTRPGRWARRVTI